jgi:hypothetical protein
VVPSGVLLVGALKMYVVETCVKFGTYHTDNCFHTHIL